MVEYDYIGYFNKTATIACNNPVYQSGRKMLINRLLRELSRIYANVDKHDQSKKFALMGRIS